MMKNLLERLISVCVICVLALATGGVATAGADVVVIPPTPFSGDPDEQRLNSISTLTSFYVAIDEAPPQGRLIQLQPGVYDFSALVILDPVGDPPENYSVGLGGAVHYFDPYGLVGKPPFEDVGYGIPILGKQYLTISGASSPNGKPKTIIRGCIEPECFDLAFYYNIAFSIGGDFEIPSRFVKVEHISFVDFSYAFIVDSDEPDPRWGVSDPRFGEGTEDLLIENNVFTNVIENFFGRKQLRLTIRGNDFVWTGLVPEFNVHVALLGSPSDRHPIDAIIEGNTFDGVGGTALLLMNQHEGTIVRGNHFKHSNTGLCYADSIGVLGGDHGIHPIIPGSGLIKENTIDGGCVGIWVYGNSGWEIRENTVHKAFYGVWTEWGPYFFGADGIIQPTVAEDNLVIENDLRFNSFGVFIGARARNNTYRDNDVRHNDVAGYYLDGPFDLGFLTLGPPSGNTIIGADSESVVDLSGCYEGPGGCPQIDEDGDGLYSEDPVDNVNNDGDVIFGYSLNDEDLEEVPNVFIND